MPIIASIGAMTSRAWGQFKAAAQAVGYYLYAWGANPYGTFGNSTTATNTVNTLTQVSPDISTPATPDTQIFDYGAIQIKGDGSLWGWGYNGNGPIGDGTTVSKSFPVQVGTLTDWRKISSSSENSFAIKADGTLWAWGLNDNGQLGDGTIISKSSPVQIGTLTNWAKISKGISSAYAIKTDGTLWAWGNNSQGRLGDSTTVNKSSPVQIGTLTTWADVSGGATHAIALSTSNTLWAWGANSAGQLGISTTTNRSSPSQIGTLTTWSKISGFDETSCAIKTDGSLWIWGDNAQGQLGQSDIVKRSSPIQVGTLNTWSVLSTGYSKTIAAIKTDGTLWAWGQNATGTLGNGSTNNYSSPIQIGGRRDWLAARDTAVGSIYITKGNLFFTSGSGANGALANGIDGGAASSPIMVGSQGYWGSSVGSESARAVIAPKYNGSLWVWGYAASGALGLSSTTSRSSPTQLGTLTNWLHAANGNNRSIAIKNNGTLWAWGSNSNGELGTSNTTSRSSPVQVGTLTTWRDCVTSSNNSYAISMNKLWGWGENGQGQIGDGTTNSRSSPVQVGVAYIGDAQKVVAGNLFAACLGDYSGNGSLLYTFGYNFAGQLGTGSTINQSNPSQLGTARWTDAACGNAHMIAIKADGTLWAWGGNGNGQLGNGVANVLYSSPIQIGTLTNWAKVTAGNGASYAIKTDGTLWAWGSNASGELGNGSYTDVSSPVQIGTLTSWVDFAGRESFATGINNNGNSFYSCGYNQDGQLGLLFAAVQGTRSSPVQVGTTRWKKVAVSDTASGIQSDDSLWVWGNGSSGEIGDGTTNSRSSPVQVGTTTNWSNVVSGVGFIAAIKNNGTLWTWGYNGGGRLGNGGISDSSSPTQIGTLTNWSKISSSAHSLAVKTDNSLWAWGVGTNGRLGNGTTTGRSSPVQIGTLTNWLTASAGSDFGSAIKTDGTLWMWGRNQAGQLGDGTTISRSSPVQLGSATDWASVSAGSTACYGIKTDGTLWSWGANSSGRLGDGTTDFRSSPVQIGTLTNWASVGAIFSSYGSSVLAVKTDGTLWAWGFNQDGQLGDGSSIDKSSPVQIGLASDWNSSAVGASSFGLKST